MCELKIEWGAIRTIYIALYTHYLHKLSTYTALYTHYLQLYDIGMCCVLCTWRNSAIFRRDSTIDVLRQLRCGAVRPSDQIRAIDRAAIAIAAAALSRDA